ANQAQTWYRTWYRPQRGFHPGLHRSHSGRTSGTNDPLSQAVSARLGRLEWARLGSNQRPPAREAGRDRMNRVTRGKILFPGALFRAIGSPQGDTVGHHAATHAVDTAPFSDRQLAAARPGFRY